MATPQYDEAGYQINKPKDVMNVRPAPNPSQGAYLHPEQQLANWNIPPAPHANMEYIEGQWWPVGFYASHFGGYKPTYWEDPIVVARWHNAIAAAPPGWKPPDWLDTTKLEQAYYYLQQANGNKPWYEWRHLNTADPGRGFLQNMAVPPDDFLWPQDKEITAQNVKLVQAGKAPWSALSADQRRKILLDPTFDMSQWDVAVQNEMMADPNFVWAGLPSWQKPLHDILGQPVVAGVVQSLPMALVGGIAGMGASPIGAAIGAGTPILLGALGGAAQMAPQGSFIQRAGATILGGLQLPVQTVESLGGLVGQVGESAINPQGFGDIETVIGSADALAASYKVGRGAFEVSNLIPEVVGNSAQLWDRFAATMEALLAGGLSPEKIEEIRTAFPVAGLKQAWRIGSAHPEEVPWGLDAMKQAREEILAGGDPTTVVNHMIELYGLSGTERDLIGKMIADPLNFVPRYVNKGLANEIEGRTLINKLTSQEAPTMLGAAVENLMGPQYVTALERTRGLKEAGNMYQAMVRTSLMGLDEAAAADAAAGMSGYARFVAGITDKGLIRVGKFTNAGLLDAPVEMKGIKGFVNYLTTLTPDERAIAGQQMAANHITNWLINIKDPETFNNFMTALAHGDMETAAGISSKAVGSPEFYTILPLLKDFMEKKMPTLFATWANQPTQDRIAMLNNLAAALDMEPARVLDALENSKDAPTIFEQFKQKLQGMTDPQARAMLDDMVAGPNGEPPRMTANDLKAMTDLFTGPQKIPWRQDIWAGMVAAAFDQHFSEWAKTFFNLKADSPFFRFAHVLKAAQGILLMGGNPAYMIRNTINDVVTRSAVGVGGFLSGKEIRGWLDRFEVRPSRLHEGIGMIGESEYQFKGENATSRMVASTRIGKGPLATADKVLRGVGSKMPFTRMSGWVESLEGQQAFVIGMKKMWGKIWNRETGFRKMPPELIAHLTNIDPDAPKIIYSAIEAGMNREEIYNALYGQAQQASAKTYVRAVADRMGTTYSQAVTMLDQLGVIDRLDTMLKTARTEGQTRAVFRNVDQYAKDQMTLFEANRIANRAAEVADQVTVAGAPAAMDILLSANNREIDAWLDQYFTYGEVADQIRFIDDPALRSKLWRDARVTNAARWNRTNGNNFATYKGMLDGMKWSAEPEIVKFMNELAGVSEAKRLTYEKQLAALDEWQLTKFENEDAMWKKWDELQVTFDKDFKTMFLKEHNGMLAQGDAMGKFLARRYTPAVGKAFADGWKQVVAARDTMINTVQLRRAEFAQLPYQERIVAKAQFYQDEYPKLILRFGETRKWFGESLQDAIAGRPPKTPPTAEVPVAPVTPVTETPPGEGGTPPATPVETGPVDPATAENNAYAGVIADAELKLRQIFDQHPEIAAKLPPIEEGPLNENWQHILVQFVHEYGGIEGARKRNYVDVLTDPYVIEIAVANKAQRVQQVKAGEQPQVIVIPSVEVPNLKPGEPVMLNNGRLDAVIDHVENGQVFAKLPDGSIVDVTHMVIAKVIVPGTAPAPAPAAPAPVKPLSVGDKVIATLNIGGEGGTMSGDQPGVIAEVIDQPEGKFYVINLDNGAGLTPMIEDFSVRPVEPAPVAEVPPAPAPAPKSPLEQARIAFIRGREGAYEGTVWNPDIPGEPKTFVESTKNTPIQQPLETILREMITEIGEDIQPENVQQHVKALGGILPKDFSDIFGGKLGVDKKGIIPGLMNNVGQPMDTLAVALERDGYLPPGTVDNVSDNGGVNALMELLRRSTTEAIYPEGIEVFDWVKRVRSGSQKPSDVARTIGQMLGGFENPKLKIAQNIKEVAWERLMDSIQEHDAARQYLKIPFDKGTNPLALALDQFGGTLNPLDYTTDPIEGANLVAKKLQEWNRLVESLPEDRPPEIAAQMDEVLARIMNAEDKFSIQNGEKTAVKTQQEAAKVIWNKRVYAEQMRLMHPDWPEEKITNNIILVDGLQKYIDRTYNLGKDVWELYSGISTEGSPDLMQKETGYGASKIGGTLDPEALNNLARSLSNRNPDAVRNLTEAIKAEPTAERRLALLDAVWHINQELAETVGLQLDKTGLWQGTLGGVTWNPDGTALIHLLENHNVSTVAHEMIHPFIRFLQDIVAQTGNEEAVADLRSLRDWTELENVSERFWKTKNGNMAIQQTLEGKFRFVENPGDPGREFATFEQAKHVLDQEMAARGWERYLAEGVAPTPGLLRVFENFKIWMLEIYHSIVGSPIDVNITPEVRDIFERWAGREPGVLGEPEPPKPNTPGGPRMTKKQLGEAATSRIRMTVAKIGYERGPNGETIVTAQPVEPDVVMTPEGEGTVNVFAADTYFVDMPDGTTKEFPAEQVTRPVNRNVPPPGPEPIESYILPDKQYPKTASPTVEMQVKQDQATGKWAYKFGINLNTGGHGGPWSNPEYNSRNEAIAYMKGQAREYANNGDIATPSTKARVLKFLDTIPDDLGTPAGNETASLVAQKAKIEAEQVQVMEQGIPNDATNSEVLAVRKKMAGLQREVDKIDERIVEIQTEQAKQPEVPAGTMYSKPTSADLTINDMVDFNGVTMVVVGYRGNDLWDLLNEANGKVAENIHVSNLAKVVLPETAPAGEFIIPKRTATARFAQEQRIFARADRNNQKGWDQVTSAWAVDDNSGDAGKFFNWLFSDKPLDPARHQISEEYTANIESARTYSGWTELDFKYPNAPAGTRVPMDWGDAGKTLEWIKRKDGVWAAADKIAPASVKITDNPTGRILTPENVSPAIYDKLEQSYREAPFESFVDRVIAVPNKDVYEVMSNEYPMAHWKTNVTNPEDALRDVYNLIVRYPGEPPAPSTFFPATLDVNAPPPPEPGLGFAGEQVQTDMFAPQQYGLGLEVPKVEPAAPEAPAPVVAEPGKTTLDSNKRLIHAGDIVKVKAANIHAAGNARVDGVTADGSIIIDQATGSPTLLYPNEVERVASQEVIPDTTPPAPINRDNLMAALLTRIENGAFFDKARDFEAYIKEAGFNLEDEKDLNLAYDIMEGAYNLRARQLRKDVGLAVRLETLDLLESELTTARRTLSKMKLQQFSTPLTISEAAAFAADVQPLDTVGEPSAGTANLVDSLRDLPDIMIRVNEIDAGRRQVLAQLGYSPTAIDLMSADWVIQNGKKAPPYATVMITNPPWGSYSTGKYGKPVNQPVVMNDWSQRFAYLEMSRLADDGRFVGVMPTNWLYNMDRTTREITPRPSEFYKWLKNNYTVQAVIESPAGAYKARATDIGSLLVVIDKTPHIFDVPTIERFGSATPKDWKAYAEVVQSIPRRTLEAINHGQEQLRTTFAGPNETGLVDPNARAGIPEANIDLIGQPVTPPGNGANAGGRYGGLVQPTDAGRAAGGSRTDVGEPGQPIQRGEAGAGTKLVEGQPASLRSKIQREPYTEQFLNKRATGRAAIKASGSFTEYAGRSPLRPGIDPEPHPHPNIIVETKGLAGTPYPDLEETYRPSPAVLRAMDNRTLSYEGNLDPIWATIQQNDKYHMGMLVADDVGTGKSRVGAGFVIDRIEKGYKKILVVTTNEQNVNNLMNVEFPQVYSGRADENGMYITAPPKDFPAERVFLRGESFPEIKANKAPIPTFEKPTVYFVTSTEFEKFEPRIKELGIDALVVDEVHDYKNIGDTNRGLAWVDLHKDLINRNVSTLYLSATPGVDISDLQYLFGLKVWALDGFEDWIKVITGEKSPDQVKQMNNDKAVIQQWADAITQAREKINTIEEDKFVRGEARQVLTVGKVSTYKIVDRFYKADNYSFLIGEKEGPFTTDMASEAQAVILAAKVNSKLTGDLATYSRNDIYNIINDAQSEFASEFHQPTRDQITSLGAAGIREASDILNKKKSWGSKGVNVFEATLSAAHTEQIMRELKTTGSYMSRDISRTGVEFNPLEITPSPEQVAKLDQRINFYKKVYETWRKYGAMNEGPKATSARYGLSGDFQADIKRTLFDMRLPSVIDEANKAIANGEKVVISIVNVNEVNGETGNLVAALNKINTKSREKLGEGVYSDPVDIPEALVDVLMLRDELKDMPVLASPITMLQDAFGDRADFVIGETSPKARERAAYNFQHDKLDVIVISGAGKQGINLHDITGKRVHLIVADYEWSATKFKQELGRVDRTGEATAPKVTVVHSGSAAERKFIATISNRMAGLGATSKGSSGSTGTESLTEMFELSTAIDKMAVAATWEGLDNETKGMFLDHYFDDSNIPGAANKRGTLDSDARALKKFLLALQTINRDKANEIYDLYEAKRAELNGISTEEGASASLKTASHTGEIIRQVQLGDNLRLSEVRDAGGHKFAVLDGILTPHMNAVKGIVTVGDDIGLRYMLDGKAWMRWVEFYDPEKNQYVVGLKIKPTRIKEVGQYFHLKIGSQHTPDNAMVDLRAGDKIQLSGHENAKWELYIGHGGSREDKIVVEGARIKDKDVLMNNGASYSAIGNFFFVEAEKLQQFIKRFPIFNDEPPVPHDDTPLFQAADPRQRAGAYEQASGSSPDHGQVLEDGWTNYVRPLLSAMEEEAVATLGRRPLRMGGADDATQAALAKYLGEVNQDMAGAKLQTMRWGEIQRDEALLNYNRRYGFDKFLDVVFPYQFWYTRTMMNWALRALDRPAWLSNYARLRNVFSTFQSNTPARLQGKIAIPMPFLPAWMGGTLYVDPWGTIFPFVQFAQPFDQMTRDQMSQEASAGFLIQGWVADGTMDTYSGQQALQTHAGPAWDKAMAQASLDTQQEISNPFDFVRLMFGPAWYLSMPLNALGIKVPLLSTGNRQDISQLPLTRTAEAAQAVTEGTWAAPIGDILSVFAKPEEWIRGAAGLPKQGEYGDYYINRQLANMVGDGEISTNDATMAMIQRTGPAFDAAVKRVGVELAMRIPGAATLYAITHNTPLQEIAASIPVSLFGSQILPTGELKFRGQTDEWNQAWDRYNAGDTKAITAFFDKYPEYEAYIARKKAPEDLLRSFLTGQIWDKYMALSSGDKKMANAQMGNNFETAFLDSNTRDYTAIDLNTLAMWSRYLGGLVPNVKQTATTANTPDTQITMPTFLPENINVALKAYNGEKDARFPGISNIQSMYYALKPEQQAAFKIRFPEYGKYLAWRKEYISAHPAVRPFIDSYYAQDILSGKVNASEETKSLLKLFYSQDYQDPLYGAADYLKDASQTLWEQLFDYQLFKQQPSDAAMTELQIIWEASGRPGGTLRKFLDEIIMPTLQQ